MKTNRIRMAVYKEIKVEIRSKLAIITFNRPKKKNAISSVMYSEITSALNEISENENISITALTGTGEYYSSGTDLAATSIGSMETFISEASQRLRAFVNAFINHSKILVAVVNGPAIGIAVTTLGLCDIVYCSDTATFQTPFTRLGMSAEGCSSYTFPKIMGLAKANEMLLFNYKMSAEEALKVGFVVKVYPKEYINSHLWTELETNSKELPMKSLMYTKALVRHFDREKLFEANASECNRLEERWTSEEFFEAVARFLSKSKL